MSLKFHLGPNPPGSGGTVQSVNGKCPIFVDNSDPVNPKVTLQVFRDTKANILNMQVNGLLCNGALYTITDMSYPIQEATFMAVFELFSATNILQSYGQGMSTLGTKANVGYDLASDFLFYVEIPIWNQKARRAIISGSNNIQSIRWEDFFWRNIDVNEGTFNNVDPSMKFNNIRMWGGAVLCTGGIIGNISYTDMFETVIELTGNCTIVASFFNEANVKANSNISFTTIQSLSSVTTNGFIIDSSYVGENLTIILQGNLLVATVTQSFSSAVVSLSALANFAAGTFTLPGNYQYAGIIILTDNAGGNIAKIAQTGTPLPMNKIIKSVNGITNTFVITAIAGAVLDNLVGIAAGNIVSIGRTNGADFIEIKRSGNLNQLVNNVTNA